MKLKLTHI